MKVKSGDDKETMRKFHSSVNIVYVLYRWITEE